MSCQLCVKDYDLISQCHLNMTSQSISYHTAALVSQSQWGLYSLLLQLIFNILHMQL